MPEGRPIVSDIDSETYRISEYINNFLHPLSIKHNSYIKNSYEFVNKIKNFAINNNCLLVTGDITALYTNMEISRSIQCFEEMLSKTSGEKRPDKELVELLELSLRNNDFMFNSKHYLQTKGTAMGKRFAPALANIYLLEFDEKVTNGYKTKPILYFRYIDDIFFLWPGDAQLLAEYEQYLNNLIPSISIKLKHSNTEIDFLDVTIYKSDDVLKTKVYFKDTDTHQLLHKDSFHPRHTFSGIVRSQLIRFKRISSDKAEYDRASKILFHSLKNRGYSYSMLKEAHKDIWYNHVADKKQENLLHEQQQQQPQQTLKQRDPRLIPIIVNFSTLGTKTGQKLKRIIQNNPEFKNDKVLVAYKQSKSLKQMLVSSKLEYKKKGSFKKCVKPQCLMCVNNTKSTRTFSSKQNKRQFKIAQDMTCTTENLIYVITCRKCGIQYVGETGRGLKDRLYNHKSDIKTKEKTPISIHFNSENHSGLDLEMIGIEKIADQPNSIKIRKRKEQEWQNRLETKHPKGLNGLK